MEGCIECKQIGFFKTDEIEGNIVCTNCGRVNALKMIDDTAEWRTFSEENGEDPRRVGMPNNDLLSDQGIGTIISDPTLNRWGLRSQRSNLDSALLKTYIEIERIRSALSLPSIIAEKSKKLFRILYTKKLTRGKSHMGILCSCIFISCRKLKNNCPVSDIARECSVDKQKLYKAFLMVREHEMEVFPLSNAQHLAVMYAEKMEFSEAQVKKVKILVEEIAGFKKNKEKDEVVAVVATILVRHLNQDKKVINRDIDFEGVNVARVQEVYRDVFAYRSKILENLATQWEIANLPNF